MLRVNYAASISTGKRETKMDIDRHQIEEFIYREARLQDEGRYDEWEELWTDDAHYWVPAGEDDIDPDRQISVINDNRRRLHTRVSQLKTGDRHSQVPPSRLRRLISNVEIEDAENGEINVSSNFILIENRSQNMTTWAGRTIHGLRQENGELKLARKKVMLVNNADALPTMTFLI